MILQLLLALLLPSSSGALSLFMRTTWLAEVPEPVWRSWFELIARGRREGPASPFYVAELGLQNTACCENGPVSRGCVGAKFSALGCSRTACSRSSRMRRRSISRSLTRCTSARPPITTLKP